MIRSKDENPVNIEQGYMIANKIADCHEAAIKLFGENFHEKTKPIRLALDALMAKSGCDAVEAGLHLLKYLDDKGEMNPMAVMMTCAVVYDIRALYKLADDLEPIIEEKKAAAASGDG